MTVTELLEGFANPDMIQSLSLSDKLTAGLVTTLLGMGITFSALIILQFIIAWMDQLLNKKKQTPGETIPIKPQPADPPDSTTEITLQDDLELVAVITSVLAMNLKTSVENIVIKNIEKIEDRSPAWNRAGIIEQMNNRL